MKRIAVIGLRNLREFKEFIADFVQKSDLELHVGSAYDKKNEREYIFIMCEDDIGDMPFDDIIECDPIRLSLRLRIRRNEE